MWMNEGRNGLVIGVVVVVVVVCQLSFGHYCHRCVSTVVPQLPHVSRKKRATTAHCTLPVLTAKLVTNPLSLSHTQIYLTIHVGCSFSKVFNLKKQNS